MGAGLFVDHPDLWRLMISWLRPKLVHHTPLPPARNGIADYAVRMIDALRPHFEQVVHPYGPADPLTDIAFSKAAKTKTPLKAMPVYQIGNNWQHTDILEQALNQPGVVILHDLQLFYLYESLGRTPSQTLALMHRSNPAMGARALGDMLHKQPTPKLPYLLCNMLADVVTRSHAIVVHSDFAKRYIARHFGKGAADKISVIPHFAIPVETSDAASLRQRYGYDTHSLLVVTAGFASRAKCFDQIAEAIAALREQGHDMVWIHAGDPQHGDVDLNALAARYPSLEGGFIATGYLDEQALDDHVGMADILLNMRFPTVGESSGSLARALAAGACTVVSDTGSYAEIPDSAVVHFPALGSGQDLQYLLMGLASDPALRRRLSQGATQYATTTLSLERYGRMLERVIMRAAWQAQWAALKAKLAPRAKPATTLWFDISTPEGREQLAQAQMLNPEAVLDYAAPKRGSGAIYVGMDAHGL